jgi:hypothetical protein
MHPELRRTGQSHYRHIETRIETRLAHPSRSARTLQVFITQPITALAFSQKDVMKAACAKTKRPSVADRPRTTDEDGNAQAIVEHGSAVDAIELM